MPSSASWRRCSAPSNADEHWTCPDPAGEVRFLQWADLGVFVIDGVFVGWVDAMFFPPEFGPPLNLKTVEDLYIGLELEHFEAHLGDRFVFREPDPNAAENAAREFDIDGPDGIHGYVQDGDGASLRHLAVGPGRPASTTAPDRSVPPRRGRRGILRAHAADPVPALRAPRRDRIQVRRPGRHRLPEGPGRPDRRGVGRVPVPARQPQGLVPRALGPHRRLPALVRHHPRHASRTSSRTADDGVAPALGRHAHRSIDHGRLRVRRPAADRLRGRHRRLGAARQRRRCRRAEHLPRPTARDRVGRTRGAERARRASAGRTGPRSRCSRPRPSCSRTGLRVTSLAGRGAPGAARRAATPAGSTAGTPIARSWSSGPGESGRRAAAVAQISNPEDRVLLIDADPAATGDGVRAGMTALGIYDHGYVTAVERRPTPTTEGRLWHIRAGRIVIATGATERPIVFADDDRPGIMLAGAAATYVERYGVRPGERAVIFTNNGTTDGGRRDPRGRRRRDRRDRRRAGGRSRHRHERRRRRAPARRSRIAPRRRRPTRPSRPTCCSCPAAGTRTSRCGPTPAARSGSTSGSPPSSRTGPARTAGSRPSARPPARSRASARSRRPGSCRRPGPRPTTRGRPTTSTSGATRPCATCSGRSAPASTRSST